MRPEVVLGAGVGEDCAAVQLAEDETLVMSTDPITGTAKDIGTLAIQITVNDLASAGAEPVGVLLTVLLPTSVCEQDLCLMMKQVEEACAKANVQVMGGHTEVTQSGKPAGHQCLWSRKSEKRTSDLHCRCKTGHGYFSQQMELD